jgi:hypothetical protein
LRAEHRETSPGSLDTSSGLLSALGGADVHAMSFAGSEILPAENAGGTGVALEESFESGSEPTNWVSHPSGIGYRRNSPGIATWTGSGSGSTSSTGTPFAGNAPTMDSGMSDGASGEELTRLANYMTGGNENPSSTQPGPTSRAEQIAGLGNPAVVLCGDGLSPNDSSVMNQGGKMGANLNNRMNVGGYFFGFLGSAVGAGAGGGGGTGTGAASHSGLSGSEQSGRTGQQGQGTAGGGMPGPVPTSAPPANPVPGSQTPPPSKPRPSAAALATRWLSAEAPFQEGDLVIITDNCPVMHPEVPGDPTFAQFEAAAAKNGFTLPQLHPKTLAELAKVVSGAASLHLATTGRPFQRIFILSHAGGTANSPSAFLGPGEVLKAGKVPPDLQAAVHGALSWNGILVLATCGYYDEDPGPEPAPGMHPLKPYRQRDPKDPADAAFQTGWLRDLGLLAAGFKNAVYADRSDSVPSADPNDAGTHRFSTKTPMNGTKYPPNVPRIGVTPGGDQLPPD